MDKPKSVREIMKEQMKAKPSGGDTPRSLGFLWLKVVNEVTGEFVPPLTQKQVGQFKHLIARAPEGRASDLLRNAVENWAEFSKRAESAAGLKTSPDRPNVDFLLKHVGVAANMLLMGSYENHPDTAIPEEATPSPAVQLIAQPQGEDAPATLAEIMAIIGDKT